MSRQPGGYIGFNRVPAASAFNSAASGVWTLRDAERFKRAGTWPRSPDVPEQISGLQLWLDASDATTLYDATTGGSLVAADGGVARWEDKSGNGRHATQATSNNRPARKVAVQGGKDVLRFDGVNDFLDGSSTPTTGNTRTVFIVSKSHNTAGGEILQIGKWQPSSNMYGFLCRQLFDSSTTYIGGDLLAVNLTVDNVQLPLTAFHLSTWRQVASTRDVSYWHNQQPQTVSGRVNSFQNYLAGYFIGKADSNSAFGFHPFDIAEIIIYDSAISDADRSAVESYLATKWGIS